MNCVSPNLCGTRRPKLDLKGITFIADDNSFESTMNARIISRWAIYNCRQFQINLAFVSANGKGHNQPPQTNLSRKNNISRLRWRKWLPRTPDLKRADSLQRVRLCDATSEPNFPKSVLYNATVLQVQFFEKPNS